MPDSPALEKLAAQSNVTAADWVSWSQDLCFLFDKRVWNSWVKSSLRLYLRRLLWWWFMTGIASKWVKEFWWMFSMERISKNCFNNSHTCGKWIILIIHSLFLFVHPLIIFADSFKWRCIFAFCFPENSIKYTLRINIRTLKMHFPWNNDLFCTLSYYLWAITSFTIIVFNSCFLYYKCLSVDAGVNKHKDVYIT